MGQIFRTISITLKRISLILQQYTKGFSEELRKITKDVKLVAKTTDAL